MRELDRAPPQGGADSAGPRQSADAGLGRILLLNGVSSSGKTTIATALEARLGDYFRIGIDDFDLMIERMERRESGKLIPVETERYFHRTLRMFSESGINLIVDHVLHDERTHTDFFETLGGLPMLKVGVFCPLDLLERRERERGDRPLGLARRQAEYAHRGMRYDLTIDTSRGALEERIERILRALGTEVAKCPS